MGLRCGAGFLGIKSNTAVIGTLDELVLKEQPSSPSVPADGEFKVYAKDDGRLYMMNDDGVETLVEVPLRTLDTKIISLPADGLVVNTWLEVIAVTVGFTRRIQIFDTAGINLEWGVGAAASEATVFLSGAGTNEQTDIEIPAGSRLSIRAAAAGPYDGTIQINLQG